MFIYNLISTLLTRREMLIRRATCSDTVSGIQLNLDIHYAIVSWLRICIANYMFLSRHEFGSSLLAVIDICCDTACCQWNYNMY